MAVFAKGGRWFSDWYDTNGKRHRKSHATEAAARKANREQKSKKRHEGPAPHGYRMQRLANEWLAGKGQLARGTISNYKRVLSKVAAAAGRKEPNDLNASDMKPVQEWLQNQAHSTRRTRGSAVSQFLNWLYKTGHLQTKPEEIWPRQHYHMCHRSRIATAAEIVHLKAHAEPLQQLIIMLGYHAGMRRLEMQRAEAGDWNPISKTLNIRGAKNGPQRCNEVDDELATYLSKLTDGKPPHTRLTALTSDHGRAVGATRLNATWENLREESGVHGVNIHDLRRTWATELAQHGSIATLARMGGWSKVQSVEPYLHVRPGDTKRAVEQMQDARRRELETLYGKPATEAKQ